MSKDASSAPPLSVRLSALTHPGGRRTNEDACTVVEFPEAKLVVVADGAGGHAHGEIASEIVVRCVADFFRGLGHFEPSAVVVERSLRTAQNAVRAEILREPRWFDMRSTALVVLAAQDRVFVGHVGDSRAYLVRQGQATRLTRDDTLVQTLVDIGQIDGDAAKRHSGSHVLLQSIGDPKELDVHVTGPVETSEGDVLIACTDGLTDVLSDDEIAALANGGTSREMARRLIGRAVERDAPDNVTVTVIVWRKDDRRVSLSAQGNVVVEGRRPAPRRPARRKAEWPVAAGVLLVASLFGIGGLAMYRRSRATDQAPPPTRAVSPPSPMSSAIPAAPAAVPTLQAPSIRPPQDARPARQPEGPSPPVVPAAATDTGTVELVGLPEGAQVLIDDRAVPVEDGGRVVVPARRIHLRIHADGFRDQSESIRLAPGASMRIRVRLRRMPSRDSN